MLKLEQSYIFFSTKKELHARAHTPSPKTLDYLLDYLYFVPLKYKKSTLSCFLLYAKSPLYIKLARLRSATKE
jgi:hypothetical protein